MGRWLSEDPIGFAAGDANLYRYVANGPTTSTDPRGLEGGWMGSIGWQYEPSRPKINNIKSLYLKLIDRGEAIHVGKPYYESLNIEELFDDLRDVANHVNFASTTAQNPAYHPWLDTVYLQSTTAKPDYAIHEGVHAIDDMRDTTLGPGAIRDGVIEVAKGVFKTHQNDAEGLAYVTTALVSGFTLDLRNLEVSIRSSTDAVDDEFIRREWLNIWSRWQPGESVQVHVPTISGGMETRDSTERDWQLTESAFDIRIDWIELAHIYSEVAVANGRAPLPIPTQAAYEHQQEEVRREREAALKSMGL